KCQTCPSFTILSNRLNGEPNAEEDSQTASTKTPNLLNTKLDRILGPFRNHRGRRHRKEHCNSDSRIRIVEGEQADHHPRTLKGCLQRSLLFAPSASSGDKRCTSSHYKGH